MTKPNDSDPIEMAMSTLRDHRPLTEPPGAIRDATLERLNELDRSADSKSTSTLGRMMRSKALRFAAAACVALAVLAWQGMSSRSPSTTFADVQEQLRRVRTVRFISTRLISVPGDDVEFMDAPPPEGKADPHRSLKVLDNAHQPQFTMIKGRYLQRTEILGAEGMAEMVTITDLEHGKCVILNCKAKSFTEINQQITIDSETHRTTSAPVTPKTEADLFAEASQIPADATIQLPKRTIAGKAVIGFFWQQKRQGNHGTDTWERTYWVDPQSKLPARIEVSYHSTDPGHKSTDWVLSGFVFDQNISDTEFSMDAPAGYKRVTSAIMSIQAR